MKKFNGLLFILFMSMNIYGQTNIRIHTGTLEYSGDYGNNFFGFSNLLNAQQLNIENKFFKGLSTGLGMLYFGGNQWTEKKSFRLDLYSPKVYLRYDLNDDRIFPERAFIYPYFTIGAGYFIFKIDDNRVYGKSVSINYGIGIVIDLSKSFSISLLSSGDAVIRDNVDGLESGRAKDFLLFSSVGIGIKIPDGYQKGYGRYLIK